MKHLGDITKISGYEAPVVDVVIGGSPCQDLSVAGKRAGLAGERSGLYMEQIRIIKEMRDKDARHGRSGNLVRPRYMVWENVPGAFSSNGGKDFAAVIEEAIRVAEPEAPPVPVPEKGWPTSGVYADEQGRWSVAWRVLDAQFWGVPQRRRRIALVADFGGLSAPEILFVRDSVCGHPTQSECKGKETSGDAGICAGGAIPYTLKIRGGCEGGGKGALIQTDKSATLSTLQDQTLFQPVVYDGANVTSPINASNPQPGDPCHTLSTDNRNFLVQPVSYEVKDPVFGIDQQGGKGGMAIVESLVLDDQGGQQISVRNDGKSPTLRAETHGNLPCVVEPYTAGSYGQYIEGVGTLRASGGDYGGGSEPLVACGVDCRNATEYVEFSGTLQSDASHNNNSNNVVRVNHIVRRLTPLECERLQGFPDGWTDIGEWVDSKGKKHKDADSPRYKALGNSIAIPPWKWVCKRLCACYERDATMASLFDGIGGFPLIWEQLNGKGSCLWASEIEEFPIAVTKLRFGGE